MLSNDCKKRVILALIVLTIALVSFFYFAILGPDIFLDIPKDIKLK